MSESPKQVTLDGVEQMRRAGISDAAVEQAARWLDKRARMHAPALDMTITGDEVRRTGHVPAEAAEAIAETIAVDLDRPIGPDEHGQWPTGWLSADMAALDLARNVLAHAPAAV